MKRLLIVGAGGHGKVVADAALSSGWQDLHFLDDRAGQLAAPLDLPVLGNLATLGSHAHSFDAVVVAIGASRLRLEWQERCAELGIMVATIVHPSATVSRFAVLGAGCVVFAHAAINAGASLGIGCIVNTSASVDHDCVLGKGVHVCPGAHLAGGVQVGDRGWIGIGAVVRQEIEIGADAVVGAGAAVVANVPPAVTVVGVPARLSTKKSR